jgi:1-aminocyclopropane-1-carboxylate deaminase/D-cysteine desulfhydrase-like pyridoxal-dependent ACC family enzyme
MGRLEPPRYELALQPTPLQRLERTEAALRRPGLYVKRDDLIAIALGGNKIRSLEYWLGAARQMQADILLVAGPALSNLCPLTAAAASMAGLECIVFHNAVDDPVSRRASFLNRIFGASVRYLGPIDEQRRAQAVAAAATDLLHQGRRPYIIGDAPLGALGYVRAAEELHAQCRQMDRPIRHVFLPGSMGTTEAGFILGNALLGCPFEVHLVSVEYEQAELQQRVRAIYSAAATLLGVESIGFDELPVHWHMGFRGAGYACPTPEAERAILDCARTEGLLLEPIYSAKTFACFLELARRHALPASEPMCIIHTGGVPSLFHQFESFRTVLLNPPPDRPG